MGGNIRIMPKNYSGVFVDLMPVFQDLFPEDTPSYKCHMNVRPKLSGYGEMDI
jgi:hypothetical protein